MASVKVWPVIFVQTGHYFRVARDTTRIRTAPQLVSAIACLQQLSFLWRMMGNCMSRAFSIICARSFLVDSASSD